jgi:hypothetical protein
MSNGHWWPSQRNGVMYVGIMIVVSGKGIAVVRNKRGEANIYFWDGNKWSESETHERAMDVFFADNELTFLHPGVNRVVVVKQNLVQVFLWHYSRQEYYHHKAADYFYKLLPHCFDAITEETLLFKYRMYLCTATIFAQTIYQCMATGCLKAERHFYRRGLYFFQAKHLVAALTIKMHMFIGMMLTRAAMAAQGIPGNSLHVHYFVHDPGIFKILQDTVECHPVEGCKNHLQLGMRKGLTAFSQYVYHSHPGRCYLKSPLF